MHHFPRRFGAKLDSPARFSKYGVAILQNGREEARISEECPGNSEWMETLRWLLLSCMPPCFVGVCGELSPRGAL